MNRVCLVGRLTEKPEIRYTTSNKALTRFRIAVNRIFTNAEGKKEADFISVVCFGKQAENVCNFLDKGSLVSVEGRIQTGSYDAQDGTKRYTIEDVADSVQFLESKSQSQNRVQNNYNQGHNSMNNNPSPYDYQDTPSNNVNVADDPFADFGDSVSIDDNFLD